MLTDICEGCLKISASMTTAVVGDIVVVTASIIQQPHSGISLSVNNSFVINPDFDCNTRDHSVLDPQVIYYCTARRSGTVTVQANVTLCGIDWGSRKISITVEEQNNDTQTKLGKAWHQFSMDFVCV